VRYLVVDVGNWLFGRQVLIALTAVSQIDAEAEKVFLALTKERIENSPEVTEDEPISREKEHTLHEYYQWRPYWAAGANDPLNYGVFPTALAGALGTHSLQKPAVEISDVVSVESSNLRSTAEVKGYQIHARDGVTQPASHRCLGTRIP
jgi:hypothetical protein